MAKIIGRQLQVGVARETTRGAGATPTYRLPATEFSFDDTIIQARSEGALGTLEDSEEAFVTTQYGMGELSGEVRDESFGFLLYALLGTLSTTGNDPYTHAFTLDNDTQHQSLSLVVDDTNNKELYKLVMIENLEFTVELDQTIRYTVSFIAKKGVPTGLTIPAVTAENKFTKKMLSFKIASSIGNLSGASAISLKNLTLTFNKNTVLDDNLGTAEPEDILARQFAVEGSFELNYEDETYKNYMRDGTARAMEVAFSNADVDLGGGTNPSLTMQFPNVDFFEWEPDYALDEIVTQSMSFKASRDVTNAQDSIHKCDLVNGVTSY